MYLVEGETDAMRLWQELPEGTKAGVVGISGLDGFHDSYAEALTGKRVFVILDNDTDYAVRGQADRAWERIRERLGSRAKRVRLETTGVKDLCEFFERYELEAFRLLLEQSMVSRFKTLDLRGDPPPTFWLVQGLIARGDVHLLFGDPGTGKSWLTLELATAVAEGRREWLAHPLVTESRRVLYLDEENPPDVVLQRLKLFGLDSGADNIRFLSHQGIKLDRNPGELIEEAKAYRPDLIVVDSLTRVHSGEENSSGDISRLFDSGITPLARDTGAAVIVIHHTNKSEGGSSYKRSRGSGDTIGAPDTAFDMRVEDDHDHTLSLKIAKSRRVETREEIFRRVVTSTSAKHEELEAPF